MLASIVATPAYAGHLGVECQACGHYVSGQSQESYDNQNKAITSFIIFIFVIIIVIIIVIISICLIIRRRRES